MPAITGFDLSISGDDVVVGPGMLDGVAVAGATIDVSAEGLGDGENLIVLEEGTAVGALAAGTDLDADDVQLGTFTEDTAAATAVSMSGRGTANAPVSADI